MEITFMTTHNLTFDANILFASESIVDILGYEPHEVIGRSCFDYFHPDDVPFARHVHQHSVKLDRAAVLYYARIVGRDRRWVACECVFTVVHDILVACTSIYKGDMRSNQRDLEAKTIRRLFASSPRDPRYHMLQHLSAKFTTAAPQPSLREPRAALILNRFTRTLTIMYATNAISNILGVTPEELNGKSFYECIQENCLPEAIRCMESAKANDSIAYLRFIYRDPRRPEDLASIDAEASHSSYSGAGGVPLSNYQGDASSAPLVVGAGGGPSGRSPLQSAPHHAPPRELEAVVSCTSDGLVVILRPARPAIPFAQSYMAPLYANGFFAAPWGANPIIPQDQQPSVGGPPRDDFMNSIRDVAVFAWSLTGINGNIASYSHGTPRGEAVPPAGFPVWDPQAPNSNDPGPENQAAKKWAAYEASYEE